MIYGESELVSLRVLSGAGNVAPMVAYASHHDDEGHGPPDDEGGLILQPLANELLELFPVVRWVSPQMKGFKFGVGHEVEAHTDNDFLSCQMKLTHSILVFVNDDYDGGETFIGNHTLPKQRAGTVIMFPHSVVHGSKKVRSGLKFVIKTDCVINFH